MKRQRCRISHALLNALRRSKGLPVDEEAALDYTQYKQQQFYILADKVN
ncbi:hypothetical protein [Serratia oryzae]|nr:hypothetical protein [Serratia oryzae]VXC74631.1 hypothetical protein YERSI8AC_170070 [Enterobacterales bacterium 8AC]